MLTWDVWTVLWFAMLCYCYCNGCPPQPTLLLCLSTYVRSCQQHCTVYFVHYFLGEAIIGKNHHFVTFDKQHYSFRSPCSYLLAKDFVRNDFTLILKYANEKHTIGIFFGPYAVEIDLDSDVSVYTILNLFENTFCIFWTENSQKLKLKVYIIYVL